MAREARERRFLTPDEAAERLQLCSRTVTRLVHQGRLPGIRCGKSVRVDWDRLIDKQVRGEDDE